MAWAKLICPLHLDRMRRDLMRILAATPATASYRRYDPPGSGQSGGNGSSGLDAGAYGLTPREREITAFAAQGRSTKQIASALGISPFTVQDHLKAVFGKVGVQSRAELVAALYVRHYEPRRMAGSTPGPYGWYLDDYQAAAG